MKKDLTRSESDLLERGYPPECSRLILTSSDYNDIYTLESPRSDESDGETPFFDHVQENQDLSQEDTDQEENNMPDGYDSLWSSPSPGDTTQSHFTISAYNSDQNASDNSSDEVSDGPGFSILDNSTDISNEGTENIENQSHTTTVPQDCSLTEPGHLERSHSGSRLAAGSQLDAQTAHTNAQISRHMCKCSCGLFDCASYRTDQRVQKNVRAFYRMMPSQKPPPKRFFQRSNTAPAILMGHPFRRVHSCSSPLAS
ncbi:hypothetical protein K501DRAFT_332162 [Backusella circina FSU 941]|nr:hypothetical protein K501DRAFT_332162 [Backusella circina FSU 941]